MNTESNVKVYYIDLIELGFKKVEFNDSVHFYKYGYPYFILTYGEENDKICMEWSPVNSEVNLYINRHTYKTGLSLDEVKNIVYMLKDDV